MDLIPYLLKANIAFSIGFLAWLLLLRRVPRFAANRAVLLAIAVLAMVLPLLPALPAPVTAIVLEAPAFMVTQGPITPGMERMASVVLIYFAGAALAALWFLVRLARAWSLVRRAPQHEAFSFFARVVLPAHLSAAEREAVRIHEQVHVRRGHSLDVLLFELLAIVSWPNLLWRWALRELRLVHEHEADAVASRTHPDYEHLLVAHALGVPATSLTNNFRSHTLKTRITMLHRMNTPRTTGWRFALMVPAAAIALLATGWKPAHPFPQDERAVTNPEKMPEFPGGGAAMADYMKTNLKYPGPATVKGPGTPEGQVTIQFVGEQTVYVEFVVGSDGRVRNVKAAKGETGPFAEEAMRVVKAMPMWSPGANKGKPVPVQLVLPVKFAQG